MAINSNSVLEDKNPVRSLCSSKTSNLSSCRLIKINFAGKDSCSSSKAYGPNITKDIKSPYFTNDKVQVLNRVTAKKVVAKKPYEFVSSFPLAASVYKANSDEFKVKKRGNHKVKKSVLTLPNEPVPMPKTYTVSDLNDSEYFSAVNDNTAKKFKKRRTVKRFKKPRVKEYAMEFSDRDARYCSQLNIDLDCSSSEIVNFTGDGERISKVSYKSNNSVKAGSYPHDVWAVLRNINKFQFSPSPPESQQSLRKRRPVIRKTNNNNDTHFIETCRTEEFAYISSYEVDSKTRASCSPSSSFDRVTVIDKQSEQDEIMQQFSRNIFGTNLNLRDQIKSNINNQVRGRNKRRLKNSIKKESHAKKKINNHQTLQNNTNNNNLGLQEGQNMAVSHCNNLNLPEIAPKISSVFKATENCSDNSSIKENDSGSNEQPNDLQKGARSAGANKSKMKCLTKGPNTKIKLIKPTGDFEKQLNGITKVILTKGKEIVSPKLTEPQRKPRLALTLPNINTPKISRFEIKRRLGNQKFPIVILGKDQLTNRGIYVTNIDPPQFEGLDKQIWPFMLEWSEDKRPGNIQDTQKKETIKSKNLKVKNKVNHYTDVIANINDLPNQNMKKVDSKKKRINTVPTANNQIQLATEVSSVNVQKSKPLSHLRNKMFHFLHKNPIPRNLHENTWSNDRQIEIILHDKQVGTNNEIVKNYNNLNNKCSVIGVQAKEVTNKPIENRIIPKPYSPLRHPWAKGKWASDFIENIIKKIRNGVYYGVDRKENKRKITGTEVSTQTETNASKNAYCQNGTEFDFPSNSTCKEDDPLQNILGFDNSLTTLEIETISTNKIAVKHCVTNVVVHFDIQVLGEAKNLTHSTNSMLCVPLDVQNNQEKIFKCNTTIINAMLPAELCTIIPTMMRNILNTQNDLLLQPTNIRNVQSHPSGIPVFTESASPQLTITSALSGYTMSNKLKPFLYGRFQSNPHNGTSVRSNLHYPTESMNSSVILCPKNTQILHCYNQPSINLCFIVSTDNILHEKPNQETNRIGNYCTAVQLYEPRKFSIVPFFGPFSITDFMKQIVERLYVNYFNMIKIINNGLISQNTKVDFRRPLYLSQKENYNVLSNPLDNNKFGVISLFNAIKKSIKYNSEETALTLDAIESINEEKTQEGRILSNESKVHQKRGHPTKVLHKKGYVRFYRKCKSMSSISSYKCTPISRISNLEEFCQVLGCNLFCNVLDGCLEKKILDAVEEMKNWITDISPKQALLILLLSNKKDTRNLIRFRPVLLQGIAVNRITKADELDTEIEVIERENFKLSQYEGISYLPASPKNQDSLLEELYWIAKTTASDYQKTFDESSEKLLKSLLEKRKKLNPSYLRVMARYVGLGLLAPTKL